MSHYTYTPFPNKSTIRILQLLPGANLDPLKCLLSFAEIKSPPQYTALSYVWGDATNLVPLKCHDQDLHITHNLSSALRSLRDVFVTRYIWADSICINQQDVTERSHQVTLMAQIYRSATEVRIWLGPDEDGVAKQAFDDIGSTVAFIQMTARHMDLNKIPWNSLNDMKSYDSIFAVFDQPWFSRTWIIQEVGLASCPIAVWGGAEINWNKIGLMSMFLMRFQKTVVEKYNVTEKVNRAFQLYMMFLPLQRIVRFTHILDDARPYQATDPRDKVYALLAHPSARFRSAGYMTYEEKGEEQDNEAFDEWKDLAITLAPGSQIRNHARLDEMGEETPRTVTRFSAGLPFISPDYAKSVREVYREVALAEVERTDSLEILSAVQHNPSAPIIDDSFPSWVPRWNESIGSSMLGRVDTKHFAAANKSPIITKTDDPNVLMVQGILFDNIVLRTEVLSKSQFSLHPISRRNPIMTMWQLSGMEKHDIEYPCLPVFPVTRPESKRAAYRDTWTAGKNNEDEDGYQRGPDFAAYLLRLLEEPLQGQEDSLADEENLFMRILREHAGDSGVAERFGEAASEVCHQRRFFITHEGFFGIGPGALKLGDLICVLLGADVPFIVRKHEDHYKLVGECFTQGIMTGEVVRAWRAGILKSRSIELR